MNRTVTINIEEERYKELIALEKALTKRPCAIIKEYDRRGKLTQVNYAYLPTKKLQERCEAILYEAKEVSRQRELDMENCLRLLEAAFPSIVMSPFASMRQRVQLIINQAEHLRGRVGELEKKNKQLEKRTLRDFLFK